MGQSKKYWIRKGGITKELALVDSNVSNSGSSGTVRKAN